MEEEASRITLLTKLSLFLGLTGTFHAFLQLFLILWFWYSFLTFFGLMRLIYRVCQLSSKWCRYHIMRFRINRYFKTNANMRHVEHYVKHCSIGDWFVLYQMSRNMNTRHVQ